MEHDLDIEESKHMYIILDKKPANIKKKVLKENLSLYSQKNLKKS